MPRQKRPTTTVTHLWVKQGKTEHMATLEDAAVLARLNERRERDPSSFSLTEVSILDLVPSSSTEVALCWTSTNRKETVEASTIRFRDLESEGRGSRRGRKAVESPPVKKRKCNIQTTTRQSTRKPKTRSTNSSIVSTEGQNDTTDENSLQSLTNEPRVESLKVEIKSTNEGDCMNTASKKEGKESFGIGARAPNDSLDNSDGGKNNFSDKEQNSLPQKQNVVDLYDEDFDSSDDEAVIYQMKLKQARDKIEQDGLGRVNEVRAEGRHPMNETLDTVVQSNRISAENSPFLGKPRQLASCMHQQNDPSKNEGKASIFDDNNSVAAKLTSKRSALTAGLHNSDSDYQDSDPDLCETSRQKKRKRYPNGYNSDSDSDSDEDYKDIDGNISPAKEGQTNVTNWMRMKQLFSRHHNYV